MVSTAPWIHNPVTGEVARVNVADGRRLDVDLWLQPGAAVVREHIHDRLIERYEVVSGKVGFLVGSERRVARAGGGPIEIPVGTPHDWWNAGDGIAHVHFKLEAAPGAPGQPAARFISVIEAMWSLAALGRTNAAGIPGPLWLAAVAIEYRDVVRFPRPPAALLRPLATIARRTGRDPLAPEFHGPAAPCAIADPGDDGLAAMLAKPVGARAARSHA